MVLSWGKGSPVHYLLMSFCMLGPDFECTIFILQNTAIGSTGTCDIINLVKIILWKKADVVWALGYYIVPWSHRTRRGQRHDRSCFGNWGFSAGWGMALPQFPGGLLWNTPFVICWGFYTLHSINHRYLSYVTCTGLCGHRGRLACSSASPCFDMPLILSLPWNK